MSMLSVEEAVFFRHHQAQKAMPFITAEEAKAQSGTNSSVLIGIVQTRETNAHMAIVTHIAIIRRVHRGRRRASWQRSSGTAIPTPRRILELSSFLF